MHRSRHGYVPGVLVALSVAVATLGATTPPASAPPSAPLSSPTPMPSAKDCGLFKQLYPATAQSFADYHLTAAQRTYIMKYVGTIPKARQPALRWMFDDQADEHVLVFETFPVIPDEPTGSHSSWLALNTNVGLDPIECRTFITPVAVTVP